MTTTGFPVRLNTVVSANYSIIQDTALHHNWLEFSRKSQSKHDAELKLPD